MAETGLSWAEEKKIITYLKELPDREALDYVVDRSQALAQKGSKYAAVTAMDFQGDRVGTESVTFLCQHFVR